MIEKPSFSWSSWITKSMVLASIIGEILGLFHS